MVDDDIVGVIGIFFLQMGDYFVADGVVVGLKAYDQIEVDGRGFLVYVEAVHLQDRRVAFREGVEVGMQRGEGAGGVLGVNAHGGEDAELLGESFADLAGEGVDVAGPSPGGVLGALRLLPGVTLGLG